MPGYKLCDTDVGIWTSLCTYLADHYLRTHLFVMVDIKGQEMPAYDREDFFVISCRRVYGQPQATCHKSL